MSLLELLDLLHQLTGRRSPVEFAGWRPSDQRVYISDLTLIQELLQRAPCTAFEKGLRELIQWVEEYRDLF